MREDNRTLKVLHKAAVRLLEKLGVDYVGLHVTGDGRYRFKAWESPAPVSHNGGRRVKQGSVKVDAGSE